MAIPYLLKITKNKMKINIKKIALHTLLNILLIVFCHFLAIFMIILFYPLYFGDYSYITYAILAIILIAFIKNKYFLGALYFLNFAIVTAVVSYFFFSIISVQ